MSSRIRNALKCAGVIIVVLAGITLFQAASLRFVNPPFSACMLWDWVGSGAGFNLILNYKPLTRISPNLARAVLASEDQRFYDHSGFDWTEIQDAFEDSRDGKKLRGASTITMQVARNMFLWQGRSYLRKALEAYYTILLEVLLSKNRILEIYLNIAEMGRGVYGAEAAANAYYGIPPSSLSQNQAARLAVILPNPKARSPLKLSRYLNRRKDFVLKQMHYIKLEDWPSPGKQAGKQAP